MKLIRKHLFSSAIVLGATNIAWAGHYTSSNPPAANANAGGAAPQTCQVNTPITITFNWVADYTGDLPPKSAIVRQELALSTGQNTVPWVTDIFNVQLDQSMGGIEWVDSAGTATTSVGRKEKRIRCSVKQNPGNSFSITEGSSIKVTIPSQGGYIQCAKTYSANASPAVLNLAGPIVDTDYSRDILIGQGCTASLSVGGQGQSGSSPVTFQGYNWSVPGNKFGGFYGTPNSMESVNANLASGGPVDLPTNFSSLPTPKWYWKDVLAGETSLISCTATAIIIGRGTIGQVNVERIVNIWKPNYGDAWYMSWSNSNK